MDRVGTWETSRRPQSPRRSRATTGSRGDEAVGVEAARSEVALAQMLQGAGLERSIAHIAERFVAPEVRTRFDAIIRSGLRKAGMPEEKAPPAATPADV